MEDANAEKVFTWREYDLLQYDCAEEFSNGIKINLIIEKQEASHKCSECEEFLATHTINEPHSSIYIEFKPRMKFFYSFLNRRKEFNLQISAIGYFSEEICITKKKICKVQNDEQNKFGFCFFVRATHHLISSTDPTTTKFECKFQQIAESDPVIVSPERIFLGESLRTLLNNTKFSDVTLRVDKKLEIPAHKLVLHARSDYFEKMFSHETVESQKNVVEVDFEVEPFLEVLRYIYTQEIEKLDSIGIEIFKIANYYQINDLESLCKNYFKFNYIDGSKIFDVLKLVHDYEISDLKDYFLNYLIVNFEKFEMYEDEFLEFLKTKPRLGYEVIARQHDLSKIQN